MKIGKKESAMVKVKWCWDEQADGLLSLANVFKIQMACYSNCSSHRPLPKLSGSIYQLSQCHTCWIDGILHVLTSMWKLDVFKCVKETVKMNCHLERDKDRLKVVSLPGL